jgi:hypothetical protein
MGTKVLIDRGLGGVILWLKRLSPVSEEIVATNPKDRTARKAVGKFARTLLATTCLTVATGTAALASTANYQEGVTPSSPADFSNTIGSPTNLTAAVISGTTTITGTVSGGDQNDFIELTGLGSGTFTVSVIDTEFGNGLATIFTSGDVNIGGPTSFSSSLAANFGSQAIPLDGDLIIQLHDAGETTNPYTVTVTTTAAAPEPGTIALAGLGLAGAVALKRKRRNR